jgi:hypothetical protein
MNSHFYTGALSRQNRRSGSRRSSLRRSQGGADRLPVSAGLFGPGTPCFRAGGTFQRGRPGRENTAPFGGREIHRTGGSLLLSGSPLFTRNSLLASRLKEAIPCGLRLRQKTCLGSILFEILCGERGAPGDCGTVREPRRIIEGILPDPRPAGPAAGVGPGPLDFGKPLGFPQGADASRSTRWSSLGIPATVVVLEAWSDEGGFYAWNDAEDDGREGTTIPTVAGGPILKE